MSTSPLVSIIMNCYNCEQYLFDAIESIYSQTYRDWEIIFWDNASTDGTVDIIKKYDGKLKYFRSSRTTPLGEARNLALSKASGKYISFLDCDDMYLPEKLQYQVDLMEKYDYAMTYSSVIFINNVGSRIKTFKVKYKSGYIFPELLNYYDINMQSVLLRKDILDNDSLSFDCSLSFSPDYNMFMQIAAIYNIGVTTKPLVMYRIIPNSLTKKSYHLVSKEYKYTLDNLSFKFPSLISKYQKVFDLAYSKSYFYDAVALIYDSKFDLARLSLRKILFTRLRFFALYLILFLPLPRYFILRLINR